MAQAVASTMAQVACRDDQATPMKQLTRAVTATPESHRMPLRSMSNSATKRFEIPSRVPQSSSKKLRLLPDATEAVVKNKDIDTRIRRIFFFDNVVEKPCMSARLFACFTIIAEQNQPQTGQTPGRMTRRGQSSKLVILPYLQALVRAESSSVGTTVEKKVVQFSAYDGSSTKPPKDSVIGSHVARCINIDALVAAMEETNKLHSLEQPEILAAIKALLSFLIDMEESTDENFVMLRQECAKSMPFTWNEVRFQKAAKLYRQDLETILQSSTSGMQHPLHLEQKLVESISGVIRYQLRRLFNPVIGNICEAQGINDKVNKTFKLQTKMFDIMEMRLPEWFNNNSAISDGCVSAVVNQAVEAIANYFGSELFLERSNFEVPPSPADFCASTASRRGLGSRKKPSVITAEDMDAIMSDIVQAQRFLAAAKACRFLLQLNQFPGVKKEIDRLGGWDLAERYAKYMGALQLARVSPVDAHLVLFSDMATFLEQVEKCWKVMEKACDVCTTALNTQWHRFECDAKRQKRLAQFPEITIVREALQDGLKLHMFPTIGEPTVVSSEDEDITLVAVDGEGESTEGESAVDEDFVL